MIQIGVPDTRRGGGVNGPKPDPVTLVRRLGGRVCDLPADVLDRLAWQIKYAEFKPSYLVRAQRQVEGSTPHEWRAEL